MKAHHRAAINRLVEYLSEKPEFLAAIVSGSIAKGTARDDSDIDVYLVVPDEDFLSRKSRNDLFFYNRELCDYPGGYFDGKIVTLSFLEQAAVR